jgi:PAS domain S-box-containing protein
MPGANLSGMAVSDQTRAESHVAIVEGVPAAVAVLSEPGSVERATRAFVDRFDVRNGSWASCPPEVELITSGESDCLTVVLDGLEAELVAAVDGDGRRVVVLTFRTERAAADTEPPSPLLEEPLDDSPAIVWLKDLDGHYLRVNHRYVEQLGTDAEHVCGRTDAELTAAGSIEGLRLQERDPAEREPLELEYRIGAFEGRPAYAALRFALRDGAGQPTAICSVAAPVEEASLARSECERLMRIDRWGRFDALAIRQELLDEWGLTLADGRSGPPLDRDDRVAAVLVERDEALATAARLEEELSTEREQRDSRRAESERAARRADELGGVIADEQARSGELEQSRVQAEARVSELETELTDVRAELEEHRVSDDRVAAVLVDRDEALATAARLEEELSTEREQRDSLRAESERATRRADELGGAIADEQARSGELEQSRVQAEARVSELETELTNVQAELEEHRVSDDRVAAVLVDRDEALATAARLEEELSTEREQRDSLRAESERAARRADELGGAIADEQARSGELEQSRAQAEARASELEAELTDVRAELEEHRVSAEVLEAGASAPRSHGLAWSGGSQRALSAALAGLTEWRSVLKHAVAVLGPEGGWDATVAWCPDEPRGSMAMKCGAIWLRDPAGLAGFETLAWKHGVDKSIAEFGRARGRMATTCLLELQSAEDSLLRAAAAEGMGSALLVPITDGGETIAMLELLSATGTAPNEELMSSLDAIALQLGAIAQLLKLTDVPRWRTGR